MRLLLALLLCGPAIADDYVARNGSDYVRLTDAPCTDVAILAHVPADWLHRMRAGAAEIDGKGYRACWALRLDGAVILQFHDGEQGLVPAAHFKRQVGV